MCKTLDLFSSFFLHTRTVTQTVTHKVTGHPEAFHNRNPTVQSMWTSEKHSQP